MTEMALLSILLVDDDDVDREVFTRALGRMGIFSHIAEANSLQSAREELRRQQFDCVLLDYHLGRDLGTDLVPDVQAHRPEPCPVILVTLRDAEEVLADSMRRGVSDYVAKATVSPERLREVIIGSIRRAELDHATQLSQERLRRATDALRDEHERSLKKALDEAQSASRAKSMFVANMSHEIRTPLNAIIGLSYLLERTQLDEHQSDLLGKIKGASRALLGIVNDVLDISKIEANQIDLNIRPFALDEILESIKGLALVQIGDRDLDFVVDRGAGIPAMLKGDGGRLHQILLNLVTNAIKFTEVGHIRLSVALKNQGEDVVHLRFQVEDTGIGIEPQQIGRLFHPFEQGDLSTTRRFGGTGLGLSISHDLAMLMGGSIDAASEPGRGSRFWVDLPFERAGGEVAPPPAPSRDKGAVVPRLKGVRVLIVDDSQINLEVGRHVLELEGAVVSMAENGARAVEKVIGERSGFDVILMDIQMPVMDGYEAFRQIEWTLGASRPVVFALTAGAAPCDDPDATLARMDGIIIKPFDAKTLVEEIRARISPLQTELAMDHPAGEGEGDGWPELEGVDVQEARERLAGNKILFINSLQRFLDENDQALDMQDDPVALMKRLHRMKGNAGLLSMTHIPRLAQKAETALSRSEHELARGLLQELDREMKLVASALLAYRMRGEDRAR